MAASRKTRLQNETRFRKALGGIPVQRYRSCAGRHGPESQFLLFRSCWQNAGMKSELEIFGIVAKGDVRVNSGRKRKAFPSASS